MRTTPDITLPLRLDVKAAQPLPVQLAGQFRSLIGEAILAPGEAVPSSRALAAHLGVSRGTVVAAYDQLLAEGYLSAEPGSSTTVNPKLRQVLPHPAKLSKPVARQPLPRLDLRPGRPWPEDVVSAAWKAAWRDAASSQVDEPTPVLGQPALRDAWVDHLRRMRAVVRDPGQIAVTAGGREGLVVLLAALGSGTGQGAHPDTGRAEPGGSAELRPPGRPLRVGVEEPGYPSLRRVPARLGAEVEPFPVDDRGLQVDQLPTGTRAPDVLLVTPSHQYPLGGSLPVDRRQVLLRWARANQVVIVEDDYDSELRYTSGPLPALAALDDPSDGRVVLLSTLSKTLTPTLAVGFLALPSWLTTAVEAVRHDLGQPVGLVPQRAVATYLSSGALRLHTQRMRNRYRRRRAQVVAALAGVPGVRVYPMDGGLHAVVESARPEAEVVSELAAAGVWVSPLSRYWSGTGTRQGIVFGFGAVDEDRLDQALVLIAATMGTARQA